ncbi:hypothetical protein [Roseivivax sediminis]|uniref:Uncharacterized protein n=1 Tax=Roseivivax sediminis TaxID=936889 RepID=A0A1I1Y4R7_9RHOB|nr:hypothetical protein [Roseivivax sediminis]SFE14594.1 hypothetical protein SAMN04515678_106289 [Roseivivax sediminis]
MPVPNVKSEPTPTARAALILGEDLHLTVHALSGLLADCLPHIDDEAPALHHTQTGLTAETAIFRVDLGVGTLGGCARLNVHLLARDPGAGEAALQARLATLVWHLLSRVPAVEVEWLEARHALPRAAFLGALATDLDTRGPVVPRRAITAPRASTPRPAHLRPIGSRSEGRARGRASTSRPAPAPRLHDEDAREMREILTRAPSPEEIAAAAPKAGGSPHRARILSLGVAACQVLFAVAVPGVM